MRRLISILIIFILTFLTLDVIIIDSVYSNPRTNFIDIIDESIFNKPKEKQIIPNLNKIDGYFTENQGQINNDSVRYYIQGKGVWFLNDGVLFQILDPVDNDNFNERFNDREPLNRFRDKLEKPTKRKGAVIKLNFEDANKVVPEGHGLLPHRSNFFYGNDSSKWRTNVLNYREIIYKNIYDNIDLKYYTTSKGLKYDFIVHPGGDTNDIRIRYSGVENLRIDQDSNLRVHTSLGDIIDSDLFIYQDTENGKNAIEGKFKMLDSMTYRFVILGEYDQNRDIIIDPLVYSTYLGGTLVEYGYGIVIDSNNCAYITGPTASLDFPNTTNAFDTSFNVISDIFVLKLNPTGSSIIYSTFLGGNNEDMSEGIVIDSANNVYVTGETKSSDFPKTTNSYDTLYNGGYDVYVSKLNFNGSKLMFSTFIGGNNDDMGFGITIDPINNTYITGRTNSLNFPNTINTYDTTQNGDYDCFVLKLNPNGSLLIYSTFIGGSNIDSGRAIAIDSKKNVIITGWTDSLDFPNTTSAFDITHNGGNDVFVFKLNLTGSLLIYSTFIGGVNNDRGYNIVIDLNNNIYVTGFTDSIDFPNTTGAYDKRYNGKTDLFVLKLNPLGSSLIYSTFIGGSDKDYGWGITIDSNDNIFVVGETFSADFPITTGVYDNTYNGEYDVFVIMLNTMGSSLLYSTFIGGNNSEGGVPIAIDSYGNIYTCGITESSDFPNTTNAYDNTYNGGGDVFVFKLGITLNDNYPVVLDLKLSEPTITRTSSIYLYSNTYDIKDLEKDLTLFFEYRDPNEQIWNNSYFSELKYKNSRWEIIFTPPKNAVLGLYDFRVRVIDTFGLLSNWFYLNDSLTVQNNIPKVENIFLSNNNVILGDNISIWINTTDVEELEKNLTIELEYKDPNDIFWNTTYLDNPKYLSQRWQYDFIIPLDFSFGYYDFRAKVNDSNGDLSQWYYANDSLLIFNIHPKVRDIKLNGNFVYRTNSVFLYVNGTDYETQESFLKLFQQYKPSNDNKWTNLTEEYSYNNNRWEIEFITTEESILGMYDFRVKFIDNESTSSGWVYINESLEVLNNPPIISDDLDNIEVEISPEFIDLTQYELDIEDPDEDLVWNVNETKIYEYLESLSIIDSINDTLRIVPLINVTGNVDIELILIDKDGGTTAKSDITIHVDSRITELTPKVILLTPPDRSIVNTLKPRFKWKLDYIGDEIINYSIFLDENTEPRTLIISNISETSYTLENKLDESKIYYWKVIPSDGICLSDPFSFTIDLNFKPIYKVNLTPEKNYIMINQDSSTEINLIIENEGNSIDNFEIEYNSDRLQSQINIDKTNIQLDSGVKSFLKLRIDIPENFELGKYSVLVTAASLNDETVNEEITIIVEIVGKDFVPNYYVGISVFPKLIEIEQNKSKKVILTIINEGNIADKYIISFESDDFTSIYIQFEEDFILLNPGDKKNVTVNIIVPENMKIGVYNITFIVKSDLTLDNATLIVQVREKPTVDKHGGKEDNLVLFIIIGIIIIIIMFIIVLLFLKQKKGPKKELSTTKSETTKPISSSTPKEAQDIISETPTVPQVAVLTPASPAQRPTVPQIPPIQQGQLPSNNAVDKLMKPSTTFPTISKLAGTAMTHKTSIPHQISNPSQSPQLLNKTTQKTKTDFNENASSPNLGK